MNISSQLLFITPAYAGNAVGGLAVSARRIVRHLSTAYPIHVITPTPGLAPLTYRQVEQGGIPLVEVGASTDTALFLQHLADVIEAISRPLPNPVYLSFCCNALAYATTIAARRQGSSPLLFARGNDIDLEVFGGAAFFIHYALSHARQVFCVSREMQATIHAFCPGAKPLFIANGVEVEDFPFQSGYTPATPPVIGLFGDIKQKKGLDLLLAALDFDRLTLRIVGDLREEAGKLLHGFHCLHPQAAISHAPYTHRREGLLKAYGEVDIVCIPSTHEGMSNVMLEAMALGKLCVCSAVGGAKDVIRDGENGFLFEPRSVESLGLALGRAEACLRDGHEAIRQQASATVREHFSAARERQSYLQAIC